LSPYLYSIKSKGACLHYEDEHKYGVFVCPAAGKGKTTGNVHFLKILSTGIPSSLR
jgi:hypothetical protein